MNAVLDGRHTPLVTEDHSTLRGEPAGNETRYTIALKGLIDDRWERAFQIAQAESAVFQRFRLDRATATVGFSCRTVDGAVFVFDVLERLEMLLKAVNERVEFWHTQNPAIVSKHDSRGVA
jgi:hypothetical protein